MKHSKVSKLKDISIQRKKINVIITVITIIIFGMSTAFGVRLFQNGFSLKGLLMTSIGQDKQDIENLEPLYCVLMGISEDIDAELTDTIILAAYYPQTQKVSLLSIPRDTLVGTYSKNPTAFNKINALYQSSPEKTMQAVRELTGVDVRNYAVITNMALIKVVDEIGGVYFDVPINMNYDDGDRLHINLKKGYQKIDGNKAEQLLRYRHDNDSSKTYPAWYGEQDLGRMRTQREFMKATVQQVLAGNNILKLNKILEIVFSNVKTNFKLSEIIKYVPSATAFNVENMHNDALPGDPKTIAGIAFFVNNEKETDAMVENLFGLTENEIESNKLKFEKESGTSYKNRKALTTNTTSNTTTNSTNTKKNTTSSTTNTNTSNSSSKKQSTNSSKNTNSNSTGKNSTNTSGSSSTGTSTNSSKNQGSTGSSDVSLESSTSGSKNSGMQEE